MNKFSFWQGLGEFKTFLVRPRDSLLYNSGHDSRSTLLPALLVFLPKIIVDCLQFHFLRAIDEMSILLGKLSPDDCPLGEPEGMLLKIYSGSDSALKAFVVSSVTLNSGLSRTGCCLSKAPCEQSERVTVVQDMTYLHDCPGENDSNHRSLRVMQKNR